LAPYEKPFGDEQQTVYQKAISKATILSISLLGKQLPAADRLRLCIHLEEAASEGNFPLSNRGQNNSAVEGPQVL
jgi:hypothetical protein